VAERWIFKWSRLFPFIRLVKQAKAGIPLMRRLLIGSWRTGKLRRGEATINESIHDSVLERFDNRVIELGTGGARMLTYRPRNLAPVVPERAPAPRPDATKLRRVKIFTVHGTFAHEADWHKWDKEAASKKREDRAFINRLREHLEERGVGPR